MKAIVQRCRRLWYSHDDFVGWKSAVAPYYGASTNTVVAESVAAFGEVTWHATEQFDLTGGLRATYDRSSIDAFGLIATAWAWGSTLK